jgi:hypothetical protein
MTRAEQTDVIISKLGNKLADLDNVQDKIAKSFSAWFRDLVANASPPPPEEEAAAAGGGEEEVQPPEGE